MRDDRYEQLLRATARKLNVSPMFVFRGALRRDQVINAHREAEFQYNKYKKGNPEDLPDSVKNFCIDVMANRIKTGALQPVA